MSVRAKFTCEENAEGKIRLVPVTTGSPENEQFFKYTPWGNIELSTINQEASEQFIVGEEYYVDFTIAN